MVCYRRRTKQSGPLGELFDHGVDACNTCLEVFIFAASQNMGQGWMTVSVMFACKLAFPRNSSTFFCFIC
jgi:ethanolaminephosphotransferase